MRIEVVTHRPHTRNVRHRNGEQSIVEFVYNTLTDNGINETEAAECAYWCAGAYNDSWNTEEYDVYVDND